MNAKNKNFETSLGELETIVRRLEEGDLPLEESLKLFEDGVKLSRECQERLSSAERRIEVLLKDANGNPRIEPLVKEELARESTAEPKIKKRIVFETDEDDDYSPF